MNSENILYLDVKCIRLISYTQINFETNFVFSLFVFFSGKIQGCIKSTYKLILQLSINL